MCIQSSRYTTRKTLRYASRPHILPVWFWRKYWNVRMSPSRLLSRKIKWSERLQKRFNSQNQYRKEINEIWTIEIILVNLYVQYVRLIASRNCASYKKDSWKKRTTSTQRSVVYVICWACRGLEELGGVEACYLLCVSLLLNAKQDLWLCTNTIVRQYGHCRSYEVFRH